MILGLPITTARLHLRSLTAADSGAPYVDWMGDPQVLRFLEIRHAPPQDDAALAGFIAASNAHPGILLLGICLAEDGRHIGNIKLGPLDPHHHRADLGFLIGDRTCWGRGYASEAISAVARYGLTVLGLNKITAGCCRANGGSEAALRKAGFQQEAVLRNHWYLEGRPDDGLQFAIFPQGHKQ